MIVNASQLELSSRSSSLRQLEERQSIRFWSTETRTAQAEAAPTLPSTASGSTADVDGVASDLPLSLTAMILERFFGLKVTIVTPQDISSSSNPESVASQDRRADPNRLGWGMEISSTSRTVQEQALQFSAQGKVTSADGRELSFNLDLQLSSRTERTETISLRLGDAPVDPLVVQLQAGFSEPSAQTFAFDLNSDGQFEQVPVMQSGAFFLVHDQNGDGRVQDGRELFGPRTGQGFAELAELDQDRNRWIDEADPAFFNLRLWQPDSQGKGTLLSMLDAGIGALAVDAVASAWQMDQGSLAESGVYLHEDGTAGHLGEMLLRV